MTQISHIPKIILVVSRTLTLGQPKIQSKLVYKFENISSEILSGSLGVFSLSNETGLKRHPLLRWWVGLNKVKKIISQLSS